MAMITYPLNNIDYSAADAGLFHCTRKSGIWAEDSFPIYASGSDNSITIGSGIAWISNDKYWGKVVAQKEAVTLDLGLADPAYNRIDAVVIQFDSNANATDIVVKKGTPATRPSMPEIVQNKSTFELCLCKVLRPAGSSVVAFANITDTRLDPTVCGLMADSVTQIDTSAIEKQIRALILSLEEELQSVHDATGILLKEMVYPVGAIYVTPTNENPQTKLGGTWELFDKHFAFKNYTLPGNFWSAYEYVSGSDISVIADGHTITIRGQITLQKNISDNLNPSLGSLRFENLGFSALPYNVNSIIGGSDDADAIVILGLSNTGILKIWDVVPRTEGEILGDSDSINFHLSVPILTENMKDEFCDKFYWRRIK